MNPIHYLGFSSSLFLLGIWGIFLNRKKYHCNANVY